ncbi:bile acid-coenzyme A ligase [Labedaea rhizosphaerae]|uniref:Bile acid-coenzyme A ligase n=1 Tax=Labedaea rhizosphaerae TaxID=598644 RepID=A0A4R6S2U2_LABRH|nr:bile acid-coenzyme A ligase [Labedaea rhizosphaerae]
MRRRIADTAREVPGVPALIGFDEGLAENVLAWREFGTAVESAAQALRTALDGDERPCVVVLAANTPAAATGIAAALAAEVAVFPLNPGAPQAERDALLRVLGRRFGAVHLLDDEQRPHRVELPHSDHPAHPDHPARPGGDVAYLLATGASTGLPRISARPGPLRYDAARTPSLVIRQTGWRSGQRQLIAGPLYHAAPFTAFVDAILDRNTVVLAPFFSPQWTVELIRRYAVEWVQLTPAHMREILRGADPDPADFASLRAVLHTAARCDADTKRGWIELLGPERVYELYGATEGIGVTLARGDEWLARPGTTGRGVLTQVRVLDDRGAPVPPGTVGTVFMRTPQRVGLADYLTGHAVRTTPDGFATVGDRGRLDRDGYLYLEPREHDIINVGGEKVDPDEVEAALRSHPAVVDAVAMALPHQTLGSVVGAQVVLHPDVTVRRAELAAHCGRRLAGYKIPKQFTIVDKIPRTASGKTQRWRLTPDHPDDHPDHDGGATRQ